MSTVTLNRSTATALFAAAVVVAAATDATLLLALFPAACLVIACRSGRYVGEAQLERLAGALRRHDAAGRVRTSVRKPRWSTSALLNLGRLAVREAAPRGPPACDLA